MIPREWEVNELKHEKEEMKEGKTRKYHVTGSHSLQLCDPSWSNTNPHYNINKYLSLLQSIVAACNNFTQFMKMLHAADIKMPPLTSAWLEPVNCDKFRKRFSLSLLNCDKNGAIVMS
ncbi:hypothetical protein ILYODFUR_002488 [Ilyodon furcidens]|uniref:Uncharacterized protein n=1 Tax=Ilyodon furcidens TaxID=33524 RepID=A0ABV0SWS9_9TELE